MEYTPRLKQEYTDRIVSALSEQFNYKNVMMVPKLEKIVISRGVGAAVADKKVSRSSSRRAYDYLRTEGYCYYI